MSSTVPVPTFGPNGFIAPSERDAVLPAVKNDVNAALGGGLNMDETTPQGQLAVTMAACVGNSNDMFIKMTQQFDPAYADGRAQDAIARIYFIERKGAQPTIVTCTCSGIPGLVIPAGSLVSDAQGTLYQSLSDATIGVGGTVPVQFSCVQPGPIPCAAGSLTTIYKAINGWDSVTNPSDGVLGRDTETRAEFEERRALSVAQNANGSLPAVLGAVLSVDGVLDAFVTENVENTAQTVGGVLLDPNSIYVAAVGGAAGDVAQAIWSRKAPGCGYTGTTSIVVLDTNPAYNPPYPAYPVSFTVPDPTTIIYSVTIANNDLVPSDATAQIQSAIVSAVAGADGGSRARIGNKIYASRYYCPINALGTWAQIVSIKIGCINASSSKFTGTISGTALTVSSVASGAIAIGQVVLGPNVLPGTRITGGGGTSWTLSTSQSILTPQVMYGCLAASDSVQMQLNQAPVVSANDIVVTLS